MINQEKRLKISRIECYCFSYCFEKTPKCQYGFEKGEIEVWGMMYDVATGYLSQVEIPDDEFEDLFHVNDEDDERV